MTERDGRAQTVQDQADLLARIPVELPLTQMLKTLPRRAKEALAVCTLTSAVLAVLSAKQFTGPGGILGALSVGIAAWLVYIAGAKTSHLTRWRALRRKLNAHDLALVDLVAFAVAASVPAPGRARVGTVPSLRLHDVPETAFAEAEEREEAPAWWARNRPETRDVFFDGSRLNRSSPHIPSGVLLELVVDAADVARRVPPGTPVRVIGDERDAVLLTTHAVLWPKGRWLAGG